MTNAQKILKKWKEQMIPEGKIEFLSPTEARIETDQDEKTVTINIYGDIMDVKTKKIIATSNLPHDCMESGEKIPDSWT